MMVAKESITYYKYGLFEQVTYLFCKKKIMYSQGIKGYD